MMKKLSTLKAVMYIFRFDSFKIIIRAYFPFYFGIKNHRYQLFFFPNPSGDSQLELFFVTAGEVQSQVSRDDESVLTIADFPVTVSDASGNPLPCQFTAVSSNFQTVTKFLCLVLVSHEP